jgi:Ca-activated chloride channel family protein
VELSAEASQGLARVRLVQRFKNVHAEPLRVTYRMPLPADGAVSGYSFTLRGKKIVGEVDRKKSARERFERALVEGRTAGIVDQERSSVFTQELGNVPPGEEVTAELTVDQRLLWAGDAWEWRFPTVIAPRYAGQVAAIDQARITVDVAEDLAGHARAPRAQLTLAIADRLIEGCSPESPSHRIRSQRLPGRLEVSLVDESGARLDRDVCVRWPVAAARVGAELLLGKRGHRLHGLLTLVPPRAAEKQALPRDLIVLLDTSGSMEGEPLAQARRIVSALVASLTDQDRLELIEFSTRPSRFRPGPERATAPLKRDALAWLAQLQAGGGTEMQRGILEALSPLRADAQRQVVLVTDGLIGNEAHLLSTLCERLPPGSRLHTVGVGSAVNRSLTQPAARAGRGLEVVVGLGEDAERATERLLARTVAPVVTELSIQGSALVTHAPSQLPDLFAGAPAMIGLELAAGGGELVVRGKTAGQDGGRFEARLQVTRAAELGGPYRSPGAVLPLLADTPAIPALYAREAVEDLEMRLCAGGPHRDIDAQIEELGLEYQIATRLTSWVAVSSEVTVDPGQPTRHENVAQELPHGMSAIGLGLRPAAAAPSTLTGSLQGAAMPAMMRAFSLAAPARPAAAVPAPGAPPPPPQGAPAADGAPPQVEAHVSLSLGDDFSEATGSGMARLSDVSDEEAAAFEGEAPADMPARTSAEEKREAVPSSLPEPPAQAPETLARRRAGGVPTPPRSPVLAASRAAAKTPAPPRKARGGLLSRLRRFFTGGTPPVQGRVVLASGRELVIEVTLVDGLEFDPAGLPVAMVATVHGGEIEAVLDVARSTRAGSFAAGQVLRLTFTLAAELSDGDAPAALQLPGVEGLETVMLEPRP